jgi:hypothetical protein
MGTAYTVNDGLEQFGILRRNCGGYEKTLRLMFNREGKGLNARDRYDNAVTCAKAHASVPGVTVDCRQTSTTHAIIREGEDIQRRTIQFTQVARRSTGTPEGLEVSQGEETGDEIAGARDTTKAQPLKGDTQGHQLATTETQPAKGKPVPAQTLTNRCKGVLGTAGTLFEDTLKQLTLLNRALILSSKAAQNTGNGCFTLGHVPLLQCDDLEKVGLTMTVNRMTTGQYHRVTTLHNPIVLK